MTILPIGILVMLALCFLCRLGYAIMRWGGE
jgi:hypothetical protein